MRRRDLIIMLGGAAGAWPLAARAQQGKRMRRIGGLQTAQTELARAVARHVRDAKIFTAIVRSASREGGAY